MDEAENMTGELPSLPTSAVAGRLRLIAYEVSIDEASVKQIVRGKGGRPLGTDPRNPVTRDVTVTLVCLKAGDLEVQAPTNQDFIINHWLPKLAEALDDDHLVAASGIFAAIAKERAGTPTIHIAQPGDIEL